jgi:hypothetical protein
MKEKTSPKAIALEYFDFFYGTSYGQEWNQMRLAMLTGRKFTALINNYSARDETTKNLEKLAAVNMFEFAIKNNLIYIKSNYSKLDENTLSVYKNFHAPSNLKVYCFDNGDTNKFPSPTYENGLFGKVYLLVYKKSF